LKIPANMVPALEKDVCIIKIPNMVLWSWFHAIEKVGCCIIRIPNMVLSFGNEELGSS
jgi:hypothetical protein